MSCITIRNAVAEKRRLPVLGDAAPTPERSSTASDLRWIALSAILTLMAWIPGAAMVAFAFGGGLSSAPTGKEAVAEMLQVLAKEKSTILVIDHDASFQNMFDARLVVRKHKRRSRIVDGVSYVADEPGSAQDGGSTGGVLQAHAAFPR